MGLDYHNGSYNYGSLWDGVMDKPTQSFTDRRSFVNWLSRQSNASLSNVNAPESIYWGNQVITRERLELFTRGI